MIRDKVRKILEALPAGVELVGAAKTRTVEEIPKAVDVRLRLVKKEWEEDKK